MKRAFCFLFWVSLHLFGFAQKEPIKITDMMLIKTVSNVVLSPDGSTAVFSLKSIEEKGKSLFEYEYVNQLWAIKTDGKSTATPLTGKNNASQPVWSPDGKQLAFVRSVDGKPQIFLLPMQGGEAQQLTHYRYGATTPVWSPDGNSLLFSTSISFDELLTDSLLNPDNKLPGWPIEKPGLTNAILKTGTAVANPNGNVDEVRAYLQQNEKDNKARVLTKLNFQSETDVSAALNFSHIFWIDIANPNKPKPVTKGFYRFGNASFFPDGKTILLTGSVDSTIHPDRVLENAIYTINRDGSNMKQILGEKGKSFFSPKLSPSGKQLTYLESTTSFVNVPTLYVKDLSKNTTVEIKLDRTKSGITWMNDKEIYFTSQTNGASVLFKADAVTGKLTELTDRQSGVTDFDVANGKVVYAKTEVANPSELYLTDLKTKQTQQVSGFNSWVQQRELSFPVKDSFVNDKGLTVEYWLMKPVGFKSGEKYPLLLEIHGGPSAMWGPGESSMWHEYQYFASKGYGVVYSNPRGSGGYGQDFLRANVNDWGTGPTSDVLTAVDKAVAQGWADTSRLLVTGGSYAGYLVSWIIAHDNRFKAACAQRGVYDLSTFLGEGNAWRLVPNYFGGYPWEEKAKEIISRETPLNYVDQIKTPLIIFHGENDRRTGVIQSEMLYRSLKIQNKPVEYVRHPGATHEITRAGDNRQRIDQLLRTWEFFERWIH